MDLCLNGKHVLITGGASGIGAAVADRLLTEGADVTVLDRVAPDQPRRRFIQCDLTDVDSIEAACAAITEPLFGLVNSAGVSGLAPTETVLGVNFLGLRELTERLFPLLQQNGSVVNIASGAGMEWRERIEQCVDLIATPDYQAGLEWLAEHPLSGPETYDFSKEVVIVYSQQIALRRFVSDGVRVNAVSPGAIETPLLPAFYDSMDPQLMTTFNQATGGDGRPEDVASVVAFVLSPIARWLNGTDIDVSGGADGAVAVGSLSIPNLDGVA